MLETAPASTYRETAVSRPTAIHQLMERVFPLIIYQLVDEVAAKLALDPRRIDARVAVVSP